MMEPQQQHHHQLKERLLAASAPVASNTAKTQPCDFCKCTDTPMWRRGPMGPATLCNACGIRWSNARAKASGAAGRSSSPPSSGSPAMRLKAAGKATLKAVPAATPEQQQQPNGKRKGNSDLHQFLHSILPQGNNNSNSNADASLEPAKRVKMEPSVGNKAAKPDEEVDNEGALGASPPVPSTPAEFAHSLSSPAPSSPLLPSRAVDTSDAAAINSKLAAKRALFMEGPGDQSPVPSYDVLPGFDDDCDAYIELEIEEDDDEEDEDAELEEDEEEAPEEKEKRAAAKGEYYCRYCNTSWPQSHFRNAQQFGAHCSNCSRKRKVKDPQEMTIRERNKKLRKSRAKARLLAAATAGQQSTPPRLPKPPRLSAPSKTCQQQGTHQVDEWHFNSEDAHNSESDASAESSDHATGSTKLSEMTSRRALDKRDKKRKRQAKKARKETLSSTEPVQRRHKHQRKDIADTGFGRSLAGLAGAADVHLEKKKAVIRANIAMLWAQMAREERLVEKSIEDTRFFGELIVQEMRAKISAQIHALTIDNATDLALQNSRLRRFARQNSTPSAADDDTVTPVVISSTSPASLAASILCGREVPSAKSCAPAASSASEPSGAQPYNPFFHVPSAPPASPLRNA